MFLFWFSLTLFQVQQLFHLYISPHVMWKILHRRWATLSCFKLSCHRVTSAAMTSPQASSLPQFLASICLLSTRALIPTMPLLRWQKNGDGILKTTHRDDQNNSCYTAQSIVPLMPGDHVCVKCAGGCKLVTDTYRWNTFSGILLHSESGDGRWHWQNAGRISGQLYILITLMHRSAKFQTPPNAVDSPWSCKGLWRGLSFVISRSDCHLTK